MRVSPMVSSQKLLVTSAEGWVLDLVAMAMGTVLDMMARIATTPIASVMVSGIHAPVGARSDT